MSLAGQCFVEVEDRKADGGEGGVIGWGERFIAGALADSEQGGGELRVGLVELGLSLEGGGQRGKFVIAGAAAEHEAEGGGELRERGVVGKHHLLG